MGEPAPTVQKIKDLVYATSTTGGETQSREENLGVYLFIYLFKKSLLSLKIILKLMKQL